MSVRAWIARWQIKKLFRPDLAGKHRLGSDSAAFLEIMKKVEKRFPRPPVTTEIETVDIEFGGYQVRGDWVAEPGVRQDRIIFYSHGGAYVWGAPRFYHDLAWRLSKACNARVFLFDYTLAPMAKCPTQINEGLAAYDMIREANPNAAITMSGDSAGGGLTASLAVAIRDSGRPPPAALALISPWLDLTGSGESIKFNGKKDVMLRPNGIGEAAPLYHGDMAADDPQCSPLFADHKGLPPMLVQVGSEEILLDDSKRMAASVEKAGGDVNLRIWPKMHHVWHMSAAMVPEARRAIDEIAARFEDKWATQ